MNATRSAAPVMGGDLWRQEKRHWHCYVDETLVGAQVNYNGRSEHAVALTPEEAIAWIEAEVDRVLARATPRWRPGAEWLTTEQGLRDVHLAALTWGKSTGTIIRISDDLVVHLFALSVGPTDSFCSLSSIPARCTQFHARSTATP